MWGTWVPLKGKKGRCRAWDVSYGLNSSEGVIYRV